MRRHNQSGESENDRYPNLRHDRTYGFGRRTVLVHIYVQGFGSRDYNPAALTATANQRTGFGLMEVPIIKSGLRFIIIQIAQVQ
jgi:hypothetical protein